MRSSSSKYIYTFFVPAWDYRAAIGSAENVSGGRASQTWTCTFIFISNSPQWYFRIVYERFECLKDESFYSSLQHRNDVPTQHSPAIQNINQKHGTRARARLMDAGDSHITIDCMNGPHSRLNLRWSHHNSQDTRRIKFVRAAPRSTNRNRSSYTDKTSIKIVHDDQKCFQSLDLFSIVNPFQLLLIFL